MDKSKQPKMATPEQNAKFNEQLRDVLVNNGIALANTTTEGRDRHTVIGEETYNKLLETITLLAQNTTSTNKVWDNLANAIQGNTYSLSTHKDKLLELETRLEKMERSQENVIIDSSTVDKTIKDLEGKLNILAGQYKGHAERLNKMEKLK
jgi:hypothetical protein